MNSCDVLTDAKIEADRLWPCEGLDGNPKFRHSQLVFLHGVSFCLSKFSEPDYSKLTAFLYLVLRDEILPGNIEAMMKQIPENESCKFTNKHLEDYAKDLCQRLVVKN
jgi:hypothetical protein